MSVDGAYVALRGYCFQFDKTILEIFLNSSKQIAVEQIQDLGFDDYIIQVKHHDTSYTESQRRAKLKKPILQLISEFKSNNSKQYVLYIYFKDIAASISKLDIGSLDTILGADSSDFDIATKNSFITHFSLVYAEDFEKLHSNVITEIKKAYGKNKEEAELYYSIISSHLLNLVITHPSANKHKRVSDKREIDGLILNSKKLVFKSAYAQILGQEKYHKLLKKQYFNTTLNTHPFERFFIVEVPSSFQLHTLKEIVLTIKTKWSRNKSKAIPDNDRFAPYIYFRNIFENSLIALKQELQADSLRIKDGHDFLGAPFYIESVMERPTFSNQVHFRLLNTSNTLEQVLTKVTKTKEVYQFFLTDPIDLNFEGKHIKVEINDIADIKSII